MNEKELKYILSIASDALRGMYDVMPRVNVMSWFTLAYTDSITFSNFLFGDLKDSLHEINVITKLYDCKVDIKLDDNTIKHIDNFRQKLITDDKLNLDMSYYRALYNKDEYALTINEMSNSIYTDDKVLEIINKIKGEEK